MSKQRIVIVGGVAGGATAAARLRRLSEDYEIIMFEKDEYIAFANCGLPYYIGEVITDRSKLLVQTVEQMSKKYNLDIRVKTEVIRVLPDKKQVFLLNHATGENYYESYDKLIFSPGASPIVPNFPSLGTANNCFTLRNIPDTDKIYNHINDNEVKNAVVIGGGFIGVEMAENLIHRGIKTTLIDMNNQVMGIFDPEIVSEIELELKNNGVELLLEKSVSDINANSVSLSSGEVIESDLTILAIGVRPNSILLSEVGAATSSSGGIVVNEKFETTLKDIYAVGDVITTKHFIDNTSVSVPLAWPANRQARLVADIIHGRDVKYSGVLGTSILKVFELDCASTGFSEKALKSKSVEFDSVIVHRGNHAGYYPESSNVTIKILFDKNGKILGAQAVGKSGVDKRIDVIATAIKGGLTIEDLTDIEICYAPPFSSAKDPVNIVGYAASNILNGFSKSFKYDEVNESMFLVDVRTETEYSLGTINGAINIELDAIRDNLDKFPHDQPIYLFCQVGLRGYLAQKILNENGFSYVYNLSGGYSTYRSFLKNQNTVTSIPVIPKKPIQVQEQVQIQEQTQSTSSNCETIKTVITKEIDVCGMQCPGPILEVNNVIKELNDGESLKVCATDSGFCQDIESWCTQHGHKLVEQTKDKNKYNVVITKNDNEKIVLQEKENKGTIVMFSGDLDKALGAMIIAQGAQAMGKQMTIFHTFWGLNMLRKTEKVEVEKTNFEKMFGFMMPKGPSKAKLSKMNMMGLGTKMINQRMNDKNVNSLDEMIQNCQKLGVKFIACTMSMDLMGIKEEELIDGLEFAGVAKYVGESENADLTLFI